VAELLAAPAMADAVGWSAFALSAFLAVKSAARAGADRTLMPLAAPVVIGSIGMLDGFRAIAGLLGA